MTRQQNMAVKNISRSKWSSGNPLRLSWEVLRREKIYDQTMYHEVEVQELENKKCMRYLYILLDLLFSYSCTSTS